MMPQAIRKVLDRAEIKRVSFLTGAGISAESGIPTFRGNKASYWTVGGMNYRPEELATRAAFERMPREVWEWYLYRASLCDEARPNEGHYAIARLKRDFGRAVDVITQNVDGLHAFAQTVCDGQREDVFEVHGKIDMMRCTKRECDHIEPLPEHFRHTIWLKTRRLMDCEFSLLSCASCGAATRPHILWFDEGYNSSTDYRAMQALDCVTEIDLLVLVGTSGAAAFPHLAFNLAEDAGARVLIIDNGPSTFTERTGRGMKSAASWRSPATSALLELADALRPKLDSEMRARI